MGRLSCMSSSAQRSAYNATTSVYSFDQIPFPPWALQLFLDTYWPSVSMAHSRIMGCWDYWLISLSYRTIKLLNCTLAFEYLTFSSPKGVLIESCIISFSSALCTISTSELTLSSEILSLRIVGSLNLEQTCSLSNKSNKQSMVVQSLVIKAIC